MAASMAQARMALRLLQIPQKLSSRLLIRRPQQFGGALVQFRQNFADDTSKDGEVKARPEIELSHPKPRQRKDVKASDSSSSSSGDSSSDSDGSSSSDSDSDGELSPELVSAVGDVSTSVSGDPKQTASELLSELLNHHDLTQDRKESQVASPQISEMFKGMRVMRQFKRGAPQSERRDGMGRRDQQDGGPRRSIAQDFAAQKSQQGIFADLTGRGQGRGPERRQDTTSGPPRAHGQRPQRPREEVRLNLFDGQRLGIFTQAATQESTDVSVPESLYERLRREDLQQQMSLPAENAFEEQIRWTREGKLWTFPINNEQGMDDEAKVSFHEHVFLEPLIADFPRKGPVRHFMELVCIGLSKNPYVTVEEKRAHIDWFRKYFEEKKGLLEEAMSNAEQVTSGGEPKQPNV